MTLEYRDIIKRFALDNAVEHDGKANPGSILGKVLGTKPELKENIKELKKEIDQIVKEVNKFSIKEQEEELKILGKPEKIEHEEKKELPKLKPPAVLRFAPNPSGALHLGHARPAVLSDQLVKENKGKLILRFDDTDPKVKVPEERFYNWIREDLRWLGIEWDEEIIASDRLKIYYEYVEELLKKKQAYVCTCIVEKWRSLRNKGEACPCRELESDMTWKRWHQMREGKFEEGEAVLRIKTSLEHANPAVRDWAAFRTVDEPRHPRSKEHLWPLFNFASAIDDHLTGVTYIVRGQEHATNEAKQKFIYKFFGWTYPTVMIIGRLRVEGMVLSKSKIREVLTKEQLINWDAPRLATLRALRRRGYKPEALRKLILDIGVKSSDALIAQENLAAYNRKLIDGEAKRYFFVPNPKEIVLDTSNLQKEVLHAYHPQNPKMGNRKLQVSKNILVDEQDLSNYKGTEVRLMSLCNVILSENPEILSIEMKDQRIQKIQWLSKDFVVPAEVVMPDRIVPGLAEKNILHEKTGSVIQFERFGFVRLEEISKEKVIAIFSHK